METVQQQPGVWRSDDAHLAGCAKSKCSLQIWHCSGSFSFCCRLFPLNTFSYSVKTLSSSCLQVEIWKWCWGAAVRWGQFVQHLLLLNRCLFVSRLLREHPIQSDGMTARLSPFHAIIIIMMTVPATQFDWQVIYVKWCAEKQQQRLLCIKDGKTD